MDPDVEAFHRKYYDSHVWLSMRWLGQPTLKCPLDMWIYQEILVELRPAVIIETGTYHGGSALFLATICDALGHGQVITIDPTPEATPYHPRITYIRDSSISPDAIERVRAVVEANTGHVVAFFDAKHAKDFVLEELTRYSEFVTVGSYMVAEDTNVNGRPVLPAFGPGPGEAVDEFLASRSDYVRDPVRERLMMTFNPGGYLKRIT